MTLSPQQNPLSRPSSETDQIVRFLTALWQGILGFIEFRTLPQRRTDRERVASNSLFISTTDLSTISSTFVHLLQSQPPLTRLGFGINSRTQHRGRNEDVAVRVALMLDLDPPALDEKTALVDRLTAVGLAPSVKIWSGRGWHCIYLLNPHVPADEFSKAIARRLCSYTKSDSVIAPMQLGRLPLSMNWRDPDCPVQCRLVEFDPGRKYSLEQVGWALDAVGAPVVPVRKTASHRVRSAARPRSVATSTSSPRSTDAHLPPLPADLRLDLREHIEHGTQRGSRSEADISLVRALLGGGWSEEHVWGLFNQSPQTCGAKFHERGPDYLRRTIERALDHLDNRGAFAIPAVVEKVGAVYTSADFALVIDVRLQDGSSALARGRVSLRNEPRWRALWTACGLTAPTSPMEAGSRYRQILGKHLRVTVVQRQKKLVVVRMRHPRDL